ncbi:DUF3732 domain-containing protein [Aquirhabdus parva]|uniref:DUF3732 domain-containing protein n=1 Tax=Aquirhabdus parva TaxID=2283318 RepID=A0A345P8U2_9GAMM|nr:DUF3732 domain-containing protein [Aquirhabdus parva]AXI03701.1 DUF3732 domain-containing protein [Aquirhabdus parva]
MNCFIKFIGIVDKENQTHCIEFFKGLNIITGKSTTGKSALIEIFDYCFGSEDYTVPKGGLITRRTEIYFTALQFSNFTLVLARRGESQSCFIKEISDTDTIKNLPSVDIDFFDKKYFMPLKDFKKELGRYFEITLTSVDESIERRLYNDKRSPTPSVRSFTSFMLQHQNLVANKHAIFYRFDEKQKKDQAIEHFKIFLGIAEQEYFVLSQRLDEINQRLKQIEIALPKRADEKERTERHISKLLKEYQSISGVQLLDSDAVSIVRNPQRTLDFIANIPIQVDALSTTFEKQRFLLQQEQSSTLANLRELQQKSNALLASINYADKFKLSIESIEIPSSIDISVATCPFCSSKSHTVEHEVNQLENAIHWLNQELRLTPYMRESFHEDKKNIDNQINTIKLKLSSINNAIKALDQQTIHLEKKRSLPELATKAKLHIEIMLEDLISRSTSDLDMEKDNLNREKNIVLTKLKKFNVQEKLEVIQDQIVESMREIGKNFDFEYKPINLKFSLETFDLWHEDIDGNRILLRAMGSGANWLYCHLTLFLALHRIFAIHNRICKIPPILFLDQPTQVYFPTFLNDHEEEFDSKKLSELIGRQGDEDLNAVVKMYNELIRFCKETEELTNVEPQIIVTDHADRLDLGNGNVFESYVRARWRTRGFIAE